MTMFEAGPKQHCTSSTGSSMQAKTDMQPTPNRSAMIDHQWSVNSAFAPSSYNLCHDETHRAALGLDCHDIHSYCCFRLICTFLPRDSLAKQKSPGNLTFGTVAGNSSRAPSIITMFMISPIIRPFHG
jgi:hypothetical protein